MKFKFIVTAGISDSVIVEADIEKQTVAFRGNKREVARTPHVSEYQCDLCRRQDREGNEVGVCRAVANIFELCKYFSYIKSIDKIEMTVIHNAKCALHSQRRADDALVEMIMVIIAASGCSQFGRIRWGWDFWNYESSMDNLFYNLFSSFLVLECLIGDARDPMSRTLENVHAKIDKGQRFVHAVIDHVRNDYLAAGADAASNALVAIWAIGDIFKARTEELLETLRQRILSTQPEAKARE